ncbi:MAG: transposon-encoded TnpW family protein [Defluviitaleaceae bacterium]|nr:transposon-encoded TnpW family protein [Defluviitaleaceae bacterium]
MIKENTHFFESETRIKIGKNTYTVVARFDESRETMPDKICQLLKSEVESKIAQLRTSA